jgi:hypothetical protein
MDDGTWHIAPPDTCDGTRYVIQFDDCAKDFSIDTSGFVEVTTAAQRQVAAPCA